MNFNSENQNNSVSQMSSSLNHWNHLMWQSYRKKKNNRMNVNGEGNNSTILEIAGNWIAAIGTVIAAIGSTPSTIFTEQTLKDFNLIGNILQAGGSAIVSETEDALLNKVGSQISAIGNLTVVASILSKNEQISNQLEKQGNLLQALGAGTSIQTQGKMTLIETIANTGNILQMIGNALQAFANDETAEGQSMDTVGSWIQAVGAVITALTTE